MVVAINQARFHVNQYIDSRDRLSFGESLPTIMTTLVNKQDRAHCYCSLFRKS